MISHDHLGLTVSQPHNHAPTAPRVWLNRREAADYIGVSVNTLDRYVKSGRVPAHRLGAAVRLHRAELDAAMFGDAA